MGRDQYAVILVYSTNYALRAEKVLLEAGISSKLIPVPRHLSSDCGVCVRVEWSQLEAVLEALESAKVEINQVHEI
ncbi:MAG: DUF3343 domain-containing protein [Chloroflexi bacterium]|nr:DUF3343 domain-containing protein [Chloroflexota bacterium]